MKYSEIKTLTPEQRKKRMKEAELEMIKLKAQVATGTPPQNPGQIRKLRRTIAKIKTALQNE